MNPTFFIAGAPRCGTTSLSYYLDAHPQVFMVKPKEPHHFGTDLELRPRTFADRQKYLALFEAAGDVLHAGDASVLTLYSRTAPAEILDCSPTARVIIMMRDPLTLVSSLHTHNLLLNYEDIEDLGQALAAQADRRQGLRVPRSCIPPLSLQYVQLARYAEHVERYRQAFGPDRVLCILLDDLRREPERIYAETLAFLGLPHAPPPALEAHNKGLRWRSQRSARVLLRAYAACYRTAGRLPARRLRAAALRAVSAAFYAPLKLNLAAAETPRLPGDLRHALCAELRDDVERLADLLRRDLANWLRAEA